ncbi:hypothetical protein SAMN05216246_11243 [Actinomyces denticolens]|uniref:Helix-turn-helix domain-containing protein n=1 Tax=Actinomyces denticolens TaxID=52767 RepID=A0ABY1IGG5_9ACTO|nr:hypothetical protein [Actinomyces denticolens]SHJ13903.1 hypothetical protein SAMN05216246_11243 [Actinomyces denticolens]
MSVCADADRAPVVAGRGAGRWVRMPAVVGHGEVPWRVWASRLVGLTPTQSAVLEVLVRLVDWRGQAIVSVGHLVAASLRPERSVRRALAQLQDDGIVLRSRRRNGPRQGASRVTLIPARVVPAVEAGEDSDLVVFSLPDFALAGPVATPDEPEALRAAIEGALGEGWSGPSTDMVGRSLVRAAPRQFGPLADRARWAAGMERSEALDDTTGWAWQVMREEAPSIAAADNPWAMWTTSLARVVLHERDQVLPEGVTVRACDPALLPEAGAGLPAGPGQAGPVGLDELDGPMSRAVRALMGAGMDETLAWAGTRRIAEIALRGPSRAHTAAAQDPRMADLGATPRAARAWMTLVRGSRRGTRAGVIASDDAELTELAADVVEALPHHPETVI